MEMHLKECENVEERCEKCEVISYPNRESYKDKGPHDCFTALLESTRANEKKLRELKW